MVECDYCDSSFADEESYVRHLQSEHKGELGRVDQRRVEQLEPEADGIETGVVVLGVVLLASIGVVVYIAVGMGSLGGSGGEPTNYGSVHEHGTMEIVIDGETIDLNQQQYVENNRNFHFHGYEQEQFGEFIWHTHAEGVTLQYALESLGYEVNDDGTTITVDGRTINDDNPDESVTIQVDGDAVEPSEHTLSGVGPMTEAAAGDGDTVVVEVTTGE